MIAPAQLDMRERTEVVMILMNVWFSTLAVNMEIVLIYLDPTTAHVIQVIFLLQ